jgi:2'-5' RNA ligase
MARLFLAVQTPPQVRKELQRVQDELAKSLETLRPTPNFRPENLSNSHCTIRFLGDISEKRIEPLIASVANEWEQAQPTAFEARLTSLGTFQNRGKARLIWAGLEPVEKFQELQRIVDRGVKAIEIDLEKENELHPHLTLVRFREPYRLPTDFVLEIPSLGFTVPEVVLVLSKTLAQGAEHSILHQFPLEQ